MAAYRAALLEYTSELAPMDHLMTAGDLGRLLLKREACAEVAGVLAPVLDFAVPLIQSKPSAPRRQLALRHLAGIGDDLAYAWLRQGQATAALAAAGRSRAVGLAGALALDAVADRPPLREARNAWLAAQRAAAQADAPLPRDADAAQLAELARLRVQRNEPVHAAFEVVRQRLEESGVGPPEPPSAQRVATALPKGGALAVVVITEVGGGVLILRHDDPKPVILHLKGMTTLAIKGLLDGQIMWGREGWLADLERFRVAVSSPVPEERSAGRVAWNMAIAAMQEALGRLLMAPLDRRLRKLGVRPGAEIVLMLPGRLALLPLHAARLGRRGSGRVFLDDWVVSQVPSLEALLASRRRAAQRRGAEPSLLAVTNPTENLPIEKNPAWDDSKDCGGRRSTGLTPQSRRCRGRCPADLI